MKKTLKWVLFYLSIIVLVFAFIAWTSPAAKLVDANQNAENTKKQNINSPSGAFDSSASKDSASDSQTESSESVMAQAEDIIKFKDTGDALFACDSIDDYKEAIGHIMSKEQTKFRAMFFEDRCSFIDPTVNYKVLSVKGGFLGSYVEVVRQNSGASEGNWIDDSFVAKIVK